MSLRYDGECGEGYLRDYPDDAMPKITNSAEGQAERTLSWLTRLLDFDSPGVQCVHIQRVVDFDPVRQTFVRLAPRAESGEDRIPIQQYLARVEAVRAVLQDCLVERKDGAPQERLADDLPPVEPPASIERKAAADRLDLPDEVSTKEAAEILGVCKDTVIAYLEAGLLLSRSITLPGSTRPVYRIPRAAVVKMRTTYEVAESAAPLPPQEPPRRRVKGERKYKHLRLEDEAADQEN